MKFQDYYKILGVKRDASAADIKKAYRQQARKFHPDVNKAADSEEKFKEVNEAYEVLKNPEKRKAYDQFGSNWKHGHEFNAGGWEQAAQGGFKGADFTDFFESIFSQGGFGGFGREGFSQGGFSQGGFDSAGFGRQPGGGFRQPRQKGEDQLLRLDITLEEAFHGGEKAIQLSRSESQGGIATPVIKKLKVNIPRGVGEGQKIRLSKQGHPSAGGGEAGDLLLEMHIQPHRWFRLEGRDIILKCPVTPWEAALGGKVKVPTPAGRIELKIAAGVQSGQKMRLKGRGMPGRPAGDMLVEIQIQTPAADSADARDFYRSMQDRFDFNPRSF